jgi:hypothetical protein
MRFELATCFMVATAGLAPASLLAVTAPSQRELNPCRVIGGEKLPEGTGGPDAICAAIKRAVAARTPNARFTAEVRVLTPSMLATALTVNGRALAEQKFAVMDRNLNKGAIERFAQSIAAAVARLE